MSKKFKEFKQEEKAIVDGFYDGKLFKDNITRDDMNKVEEFITDMMNTRFEAQMRTENLYRSIEKTKNKKIIILGNG